MHHHPSNQERALNLSILLKSGPGEFPRVESNYIQYRSSSFRAFPLKTLFSLLFRENATSRRLAGSRASRHDTLASGISTYLKHAFSSTREGDTPTPYRALRRLFTKLATGLPCLMSRLGFPVPGCLATSQVHDDDDDAVTHPPFTHPPALDPLAWRR
jgi:hypothetical protein